MATKKQKEFTLHDLFVLKLKELYYIEQQLIKALPKMAKAASSLELKQGFAEHTAETETQAQRLEQIFEMFQMKPQKAISAGIKGLAEDAEQMMKDIPAGEVLDAGLICAAQTVEHFEMAGYGQLWNGRS